jgi:hypothetical protein
MFHLPSRPLVKIVPIMARGITTVGSLTSSLICSESVSMTDCKRHSIRESYMACRIIPNKRKSVAHQPNTERDSIIRPRISIGSRCKDKFGARTRTQIDQWDQDSKESNNMPDEQKTFKLRQPFRKADIHDHTEQNDAPVDQRSVPCLVLIKIARIVERGQRLYYSGSKVCWRCRRELPPPERDPSEDPADDAEVLLWCQFGCPTILCC